MLAAVTGLGDDVVAGVRDGFAATLAASAGAAWRALEPSPPRPTTPPTKASSQTRSVRCAWRPHLNGAHEVRARALLPPAVVRRLEALGITELSTNLTEPEQIPALVAVPGRPDLCRLHPWRASFS